MPLFYFILKAGRRSIPDPEGVELPDEKAARRYATAVAGELMRNREHQTLLWRIEICDDYLRPCDEVSFASARNTLTSYPRHLRLSIKKVAGTAAAFDDALGAIRSTMKDIRQTLARADQLLSSITGSRRR